MRATCHGFAAGSRIVLVALLAACTAAPTAPPQRTYDRVREDQLAPLTRAVFKNAGLQTSECHATRVCLETPWAERGGERRMYVARFVRDPVDERYMLYLDLVVQERAGAGWSDKPVVAAQDTGYQRLLQDFDLAVRKLGGVQY